MYEIPYTFLIQMFTLQKPHRGGIPPPPDWPADFNRKTFRRRVSFRKTFLRREL